MKPRAFIQCDVFTNQRFLGNPLAVFPEGDGLDTETMQKVAREMNLSETVFVVQPDDPDLALRGLRIFTPGKELPMAGHPVVGTWLMLASRGLVKPPGGGTGRVTIQQQLKLGILPVDIEFVEGKPVTVWMTQGTPEIGNALTIANSCAPALGIEADEIGGWKLPIAIASTGVRYLIVPVADRGVLSRIRPDTRGITRLCEELGASAVYVVSPEGHADDVLISARMFGDENLGIVEDPATGSAAGPLAAALVYFGAVQSSDGKTSFIIEQGVDMGRESRIHVEILGREGKVELVKIGGEAVEVLTGEMLL